MILDPTTVRLSPHFLLSDMVGCSSVYTSGHANVFDKQRGTDVRLENGKALCEHALEPLLAMAGSFSISYGFISPELSAEIVTYQDPRKPSHHRWDLGAAVDVCVHHQVLQSISNSTNGTNESGAPILFALEHMQALPLSRLITYSESPYICVAVSANEVAQSDPRMAWYENRYTGRPKEKPAYLKYSSEAARRKALNTLCNCGLEHPWEGKGHPTYHGGGRKQLHHMRVSRYSMVSDWLFDETFVREGRRNQPSLTDPRVVEAFRVAGEAYDGLLALTGLPRLSIVSAYTSPLTEGWVAGRDWREGDVEFEIVPPGYLTPADFKKMVFEADSRTNAGSMHMVFGHLRLEEDDDRVIVTVKRDISW